MKIKEELITPKIAKQYLENNTKNRVPKKSHIERYASDILNGRWKNNTGETIKISKQGNIIDGQHRLLAIIKANRAVLFTIAYDLDEGIMDVLDTGTKRSPQDVFHIEGIKNAKLVPSIISFYNALKHGNSTSGGVNGRLTNAQLLELYYENPMFWQTVTNKTQVWYHKFAMILTPSIIGALYCLFYSINEDDAEEFIDQLCVGINISNNTMMLLRNRLIQDKISIKRIGQNVKIALILKTWNCIREGKEIKVLKFDPEKELFPKPI